MRETTRKIALSGILLALTMITLFLATTIPVNELSLYALSSFFVAVVVIEFGIRAGWIFYSASCLLSLLLPNKVAIIPYLVFFGVYGIVKYYIEKINKLGIEYVLKLIFFNLFILAAFAFFKDLILEKYKNFPWWIIALGLEAAFIVYDYAYTLFIHYYQEKLKRILKI